MSAVVSAAAEGVDVRSASDVSTGVVHVVDRSMLLLDIRFPGGRSWRIRSPFFVAAVYAFSQRLSDCCERFDEVF